MSFWQVGDEGKGLLLEHAPAPGRITEQGGCDDLVHAGGTFAELLELSQDR